MADLVLKSDAAQALRDASQDVRDMAQDIWQASPSQIETGINNRVTDLATARDLLTVLTLVMKAHEREIRELKVQLAKIRSA
jgi:hypothetical protein